MKCIHIHHQLVIFWVFCVRGLANCRFVHHGTNEMKCVDQIHSMAHLILHHKSPTDCPNLVFSCDTPFPAVVVPSPFRFSVLITLARSFIHSFTPVYVLLLRHVHLFTLTLESMPSFTSFAHSLTSIDHINSLSQQIAIFRNSRPVIVGLTSFNNQVITHLFE